MRFNNTTAALAVLSGMLTASSFVLAQDQPQTDQSVVKVAQNKKTHKARIVLTDDDLPSRRLPSTEAAVATTSSDTGQEKSSAAQVQEKSGHGINVPGLLAEGSVNDAKDLLDRLHQEEKLLIQRYEQLQRDLAATDNAQLRQVYSDALSRREETLAKTRTKIADTEKALAQASSGKTEGETNNAAK